MGENILDYINEIMAMAVTTTAQDVFVSFEGHFGWLHVSSFFGGWQTGSRPAIRVSIDLKSEDAPLKLESVKQAVMMFESCGHVAGDTWREQ
jgi:5'(3')-deoxyribonucleotidase